MAKLRFTSFNVKIKILSAWISDVLLIEKEVCFMTKETVTCQRLRFYKEVVND